MIVTAPDQRYPPTLSKKANIGLQNTIIPGQPVAVIDLKAIHVGIVIVPRQRLFVMVHRRHSTMLVGLTQKGIQIMVAAKTEIDPFGQAKDISVPPYTS